MKPKEGPDGSTTNMKLTRNSSNTHKWHSGSLKLAFLIFYFASLCSLSSGTYPTKPRFVIKNRDRNCGRSIIPNLRDELILFDSINFNVNYRFDQVINKWGYIRHINSNRVWYPDGNSRNNGTRIVLRSRSSYHTLFSLDQINGFIQHYNGLYVHYQHKSCSNGDIIHLWNSIHHRMRWDFVNPLDVSEKVLPYGNFKVFGSWKLIFSVNNAPVSHRYEYNFKEGKSQTKSRSTQFGFEWQVGAEANVWFGKSSTSATLFGHIQLTSASAWNSETTKTHTLLVVKGQSVAVWQKIITGEQLGNREVFQIDIFEHTDSRNKKPREDTRVWPGEYDKINSADSNSDEQQEFENNLEDGPILILNVTEEIIEYDENGVFSLYNYTIIDNGDTAEDHDEEIDYDENGVFSLYNYTIPDNGDTSEDHGENIDYNENGGFSLFDYTITDNGDTSEDQDELEINKVNQNSDGESNPPPVSITYQSRNEDAIFKSINNENLDIKHDEQAKPYKIANVRKRKLLHKGRTTNNDKH